MIRQGPFVGLFYLVFEDETVDFRSELPLTLFKTWEGGWKGSSEALKRVEGVPRRINYRLFYPDGEGEGVKELKCGSEKKPNVVFVRATEKDAGESRRLIVVDLRPGYSFLLERNRASVGELDV